MRRTISMLLTGALLLTCLTGCRAGADQRTGEAEGYGGTIKVTVTMNGDDITDVRVVSHNETQGVGTRAIDVMPDAIVRSDTPDVDDLILNTAGCLTGYGIYALVRAISGAKTQLEVFP